MLARGFFAGLGFSGVVISNRLVTFFTGEDGGRGAGTGAVDGSGAGGAVLDDLKNKANNFISILGVFHLSHIFLCQTAA